MKTSRKRPRPEPADDSCDDTRVVIKCKRALNSEELGVVTVDGDASIGQFKARLLAIGKTPQWFAGKKFVMGDPPMTFDFVDDYTRFMNTKPVGIMAVAARALLPNAQGLPELKCDIIACSPKRFDKRAEYQL